MAKSDGSPRLVVNFRGLNSSSNRVGYPFSSNKDVHLDVENGTFLFISFDLIQAYYQLRVAEESIHLLVFLCPWGKMCMARLPMGWTGSGDYLHITTRALLTGMDRAINIFDDLLLQPHSGTEAYQLGAKILCQAIQKNLKFSKTKFQVSPKVVFCGLQLSTQSNGEVSIHPHKSRVDRILNLPWPSSKEDVQWVLSVTI